MEESKTADAAAPGMFVNPEVAPDSLPGTETLDWTPLHPRFARRLQVGALIRAVIFVAVGGGVHWMVLRAESGRVAEHLPWLPAFGWAALGAFCVWSVLWPLVAVPRRGYVVRERDLLYRAGVLWRSVQAFPFNRVQHTKLDSTPLDRRFGLASLSVFPAGAGTGHRIRGLGQETAMRLRVYVSERIEAERAAAELAAPGETADSDR